MLDGVEHLVTSGPLLLAIPVAAAAGAVTFLSPCCLPLVPGYLSYVTGMSGASAPESEQPESGPAGSAGSEATPPGADGQPLTGGVEVGRPPREVLSGQPVRAAGPALATAGGTAVAVTAVPQAPPRSRVLAGTLLFVLGFSVLFTIEGVTVSSIGDTLLSHASGLSRALGALIILLGLMFMGVFDRFSFAGRIVKPSFRPRAGLAGAPLLGFAFGLSWTPCIGPTLSAVLVLGATTGTVARGAILAFIYGLGLGIPFLIVALGVQRGMRLFGFARRHARLITRIGGIMLIVVGLLEVTGAWASAITWLKVHWANSYTPPI
jgi:cytochrome c-type biogenesis protein